VHSAIQVEQIGSNKFRTVMNEIVDIRLTYKTEFDTMPNEKGQHEIVKVYKNTNYTTRRFHLTTQFKESEYQLLGDEIVKSGGYWQVDFSSMATINLPLYCELDIDEIFETFNFYPSEIKE